MIVQIYAGDTLAYDSRLPVESGYSILALRVADAINKGGTATITLPPGHPMYQGFPAFRTPVTILRDKKIRWRGRPLPPSDDLYCRRTITCEGELCFLQDAIHRPYLYQSDPASIFKKVISVYNAAVEPWKQFAVGTVTVTDPNDYIRIESKNPEAVYAVVQKLISRCGGYVLFDSAKDGKRRINWYADMPYHSNQTVRLGENLINYSSQSDVTNFATRIIPYGATGDDGQRLTLDIDGKDYVENAEAVALRGVIETAVVYDDITLPENLLARATRDVRSKALIPSIIRLSAIDLSRNNLQLNAFAVGQRVPAESKPHGLSGTYDLTAFTEDLLDPKAGNVTLVRETASLDGSDGKTLTGAIAVGERKENTALEKAKREIHADYQRNIAKAVTEAEFAFSTLIQQTSDSIRMEASETYAKTTALESLQEHISAELDVLANGVRISVAESIEKINNVSDDLQEQIREIRMNYDFTADGQYIGKKDSDTMMRLVNDMMQILVSGVAVTTVDKAGLTASEANVRTLHMGDYTWLLGNDGHLMLT